MNTSLIALLTTAVILFPALSARAQPHGGDIILSVHDNRITTNLLIEDAITPHRVFESEFNAFAFTDEPGFDSEAGALPPSSDVGFNIRRSLRLWNGAEFPADSSGIPVERLRIRKSGFGDVLTPIDDTPVSGFGIPVSSGGEFHQHLGYTLQSPAQPGIYLLELELWSSVSTIATSESFWVVFNNGMPEEDHEAATDWALENLVGTPCPADVNGDTLADILDLLDFLDSFGACENQPAPCTGSSTIPADFNADTLVDILDFLDFFEAFGAGCD